MKKGVVFTIHSLAGLLSGLFILLMSLSGAALVFHDELDSLQYPSISQKENAPVLSVDSCYRSLQKQFPHAQVSSCSIAEDTKSPFIFSAYDSSFQKGTQSMQVFIHPQTGEILQLRGGGKDMKHNFMSWLSVFHNSFHLKKKGEWLLGFFAIIFLLSITTGIILYRKNVIAVLLFRKKMLRRANLHQLVGVYALLFNLMIGISGYWMQRYVFKKEFYASEQPYTPVIKPSSPLFFNIDSALVAAKKTYPDFTGYVIYFAPTIHRKTAVYGSQSTNSFIHSKKFADVIFLDSLGGIAKTAFVNKIDLGSRYDIINSQVHFGKYGGLPVKILYSLFGLASGFLSITGFLLWLKRRRIATLR
ncbi:MAG: PepSY-associated TM helix domain-containing protein [Bacteroidota bacterium]